MAERKVDPPKNVELKLTDIEKKMYGKIKVYFFHDMSSCGALAPGY